MPDNETPTAPDWPVQVTETIVNLVDTVKEKITGPAISIARGVVYGTLGAIVALAALVLFLVLFVRLLDIGAMVALEAAGFEKSGRSTWIAHTITGALFFAGGLVLIRKGRTSAAH